MSEIVSKVNVMSAAYEKLVAMPTPDLREELARALTITADSLMYLAAVWKELEQRGEDLSDLRTGLGVYVPLIAAGHLAAEAVVAFAGRKRLLAKIMQLPVDRQLSLAHGERVLVIDHDDDGSPMEREMPVAALTMEQVDLVFDDGRIRLPTEQKCLSKNGGGSSRQSVVMIKMAAEEHARLKASAAKRGVTMQTMVRDALKKERII